MSKMTAEQLAELLFRCRIRSQNEAELQYAVAEILRAAQVEFQREFTFPVGGRIDFLVGTIGIEIKVDGSPAQVLRQLSLYAKRPEVTELILVTSQFRAGRQPKTVGGKPLHVVFLMGAFL